MGKKRKGKDKDKDKGSSKDEEGGRCYVLGVG